MRRLLTDAEIAYLKEIAPGRYVVEITKMLNEKFGKNFTEIQIRQVKTNMKIISGMQHKGIPVEKRPSLFTPEQDAYFREIVAGNTSAKIVELMNEKFNLNLTVPQVQTYKQNHGLKNGVDCRFGKGHIPANKGKKQSPEVYAKCAATRFKKGHKPFNFMPVGSETVKGDGFIYVKIGTSRRWKQKHILIWEAANGPKPKGHKIIFADGNKRNFNLDNLILVSDAELLCLNRKKLIFNNPEATKAGVLVARLLTKAGKIKRGE